MVSKQTTAAEIAKLSLLKKIDKLNTVLSEESPQDHRESIALLVSSILAGEARVKSARFDKLGCLLRERSAAALDDKSQAKIDATKLDARDRALYDSIAQGSKYRLELVPVNIVVKGSQVDEELEDEELSWLDWALMSDCGDASLEIIDSRDGKQLVKFENFQMDVLMLHEKQAPVLFFDLQTSDVLETLKPVLDTAIVDENNNFTLEKKHTALIISSVEAQNEAGSAAAAAAKDELELDEKLQYLERMIRSKDNQRIMKALNDVFAGSEFSGTAKFHRIGYLCKAAEPSALTGLARALYDATSQNSEYSVEIIPVTLIVDGEVDVDAEAEYDVDDSPADSLMYTLDSGSCSFKVLSEDGSQQNAKKSKTDGQPASVEGKVLSSHSDVSVAFKREESQDVLFLNDDVATLSKLFVRVKNTGKNGTNELKMQRKYNAVIVSKPLPADSAGAAASAASTSAQGSLKRKHADE